MTEDEFTPISMRLSKYRTMTVSISEESEIHPTNCRIQLETYVTSTGQIKQFSYFISMKMLSEVIDAFTSVEQFGLDNGLIEQVDTSDAGDAS
jgi:hypothetical protein